MEFVGIGNALMDVIAFVDDDFAPSLGFHNNAVSHIDREQLGRIIAEMPDAVYSAGGGAANAARTAAMLGMKASFAGSVGTDELGLRYREELTDFGVECFLADSGAATGLYCALIRSDGGRSLLVSPSAALDLDLAAPPQALFRTDAIFFVEGYLLRNHSFLMDCLGRASEAGMLIAIDLSSQNLVRNERDFLLELLPRFCNLLLANEDEFNALTDLPLREGIELLAGWGLELVVKRAERGAVWSGGGKVIDSPVRSMLPVDATGAGDAFAAGFIYGRVLGVPPERCLRLGNRIAEEVLLVPALQLDPERVHKALRSLGVL